MTFITHAADALLQSFTKTAKTATLAQALLLLSHGAKLKPSSAPVRLRLALLLGYVGATELAAK